jgi:hypothetical protein
LTPHPIPAAALEFTLQVERLYSTMIEDAKPSGLAEPNLHEEPSLGGKLLYAGEPVPHGRALLVAANIAGAASLAASADPAAGKQAVRDGVADFLVNSLDEALRILKNEIRKREAVAVCVAMAPEAVEREMLERGVVPDLVPRSPLPPALFGQTLVTWTVTSAPAQWLPRLDALAIDSLRKSAAGQASIAARWLRLAPRYLGRLAQNFRILHCQPEVAREFVSRAKNAVERGDIGVEVWISLGDNQDVFRLSSEPATGPADSLTC